MTRTHAATLALVAGWSLACSGALDALQPTPVPPEKQAYVGTWTGGPVTLQIEPSGMLHYVKASGSASSEINAPIAAWHDTGFDVGVGPLVTTFVVDAPPAVADGVWSMTVDGQALTRPDSTGGGADRGGNGGNGGNGRDGGNDREGERRGPGEGRRR